MLCLVLLTILNIHAAADSIICKFGVKRPYVQDKLVGHSDEVNAVEWNSSLEMLASASDDKTVRVRDVGINIINFANIY